MLMSGSQVMSAGWTRVSHRDAAPCRAPVSCRRSSGGQWDQACPFLLTHTHTYIYAPSFIHLTLSRSRLSCVASLACSTRCAGMCEWGARPARTWSPGRLCSLLPFDNRSPNTFCSNLKVVKTQPTFYNVQRNAYGPLALTIFKTLK